MQTSQEIEDKIRSIKPYLEDEFGIDQIGYFGSFANGSHKAGSDVDVLVTFSRKIGWKFFDLKDYLESKLSIEVDLVTKDSLKKQWKQAILRQVIYL